ncbi:MAG: Flp pilus assembly complex ATPase component TadA [Candidatus Eremiobacteraeota bacterium]|nr:Flp pilus assembly complex ATPase component TadA [Candidatus Eremiobacteraeota bacterium]
MHRKDLLFILQKRGALDIEQAEQILDQREYRQLPLDEALVRSGLIGAGRVPEILSEIYGVPMLDLDSETISPRALEAFPLSQAENFCVLPVRIDEGEIVLAMADPLDVMAEDAVKLVSGLEVRRTVASRAQIQAHLARLQEPDAAELTKALDGALFEMEFGEEEAVDEEDPAPRGKPAADKGPVIQLVNYLLRDAIRLRASDIHIEPAEDRTKVRFRIDGILQEICELPKVAHRPVLSRVKLISNMDISERRAPQDGRTQVKLNNEKIDFRVSSLPCQYGEKAVLRMLKADPSLMELDRLGFSAPDLDLVKELFDSPQGIVLVTGPTGSGKTSTLYAGLNRLNSPSRNIVTVEDPVEYRLKGVNQVSVNPKAGLTFHSALKSILRQDPDIVMLGEIRDLESAEIAFHAAQTGHLVLSTLHTNSAAATITRLGQMGLPHYLISSSLLGVLAQRLVRRLCPECRVRRQPSPELLEALESSTSRPLPTTFYASTGCQACDGSGFSGRLGLYEVMPVDGAIRTLILENAGEIELEAQAKTEGMLSLLEDGLRKCEAGLTSPEEVLRVARSRKKRPRETSTVSIPRVTVAEKPLLVDQGSHPLLSELLRLLETHLALPLGHSRRVAQFSRSLGEELGLDGRTLDILHEAALLKDLGMLRVPSGLLSKISPLSTEELKTLHGHVSWSLEIVREIHLPEEVLKIISTHHEQPDGRGYPDGLKEEEIGLPSLIVSVADTYHSLLVDRPYRKALSPTRAYEKLREMAENGWLSLPVVEHLEKSVIADHLSD